MAKKTAKFLDAFWTFTTPLQSSCKGSFFALKARHIRRANIHLEIAANAPRFFVRFYLTCPFLLIQIDSLAAQCGKLFILILGI
jgi:hypothetical protein